MLDNTSKNGKMVEHLRKILSAFKGEYYYMWCFAHVTQLVIWGFISQFGVKDIKTNEVDGLVNEDVHVLLKLTKNIKEEEEEVRLA